MNSKLYRTQVMHHRLGPKRHKFVYGAFMFYLDLDELHDLEKKLFFFSNEKFNWFSYRKKEHLQLPREKPEENKTTKQSLITFLSNNGIDYNGERIMLLTNLNILGYNFNPVSFYFVMKEDKVRCAVAEVSNTFREMKPYLLGETCIKNGSFVQRIPKFFYV